MLSCEKHGGLHETGCCWKANICRGLVLAEAVWRVVQPPRKATSPPFASIFTNVASRSTYFLVYCSTAQLWLVVVVLGLDVEPQARVSLHTPAQPSVFT